MLAIEFTKVDAADGLPASDYPTRHGPTDPLPDIQTVFWDYSGDVAVYWGVVPDGSDTQVPGVRRVLSSDELEDYLDLRRALLIGLLADMRYQVETGGITLPNGTKINTQRDSQSMLNGAYQSLKSGLVANTEWKASNGWVTVTLTELEPIAQAVAEHVRRCFKAERAVSDQVAAATTIDQLLAINLQTAFDTAYSA